MHCLKIMTPPSTTISWKTCSRKYLKKLAGNQFTVGFLLFCRVFFKEHRKHSFCESEAAFMLEFSFSLSWVMSFHRKETFWKDWAHHPWARLLGQPFFATWSIHLWEFRSTRRANEAQRKGFVSLRVSLSCFLVTKNVYIHAKIDKRYDKWILFRCDPSGWPPMALQFLYGITTAGGSIPRWVWMDT